MPVKLKLLLGYGLVVAQLQDVYQIRYPPGYQSIALRLFSPLRLQFFGWIPGLHRRCFGIETLDGELLLYTLLPLGVVCTALAASRIRHGSLLPVLPFVLRATYLLYTAVSSKGFQTLAECDCFDQIDGLEPACFLRTDYTVVCPNRHARAVDLLAGSAAVVTYGVGVPLLYAALLFACRTAIRDEEPTPLSEALSFLHASLRPHMLWWPLVETARALLLTGFLALVNPGEVFQILCGLLTAIVFLVLQLYCAPYRTASNNFLAMAVNFSLVLNFVSSVGVQVMAFGVPIDSTLLSVVLFAAALTVFPITLVSLLTALREQPPLPRDEPLLLSSTSESCSVAPINGDELQRPAAPAAADPVDPPA